MPVSSFDRIGLQSDGFQGFISVAALREKRDLIPPVRGVYAILRADVSEPEFVAPGSGGHFKGKDPNVACEILQQNWVAGTEIVYFGKAGDPWRSATLRTRLWQYLQFGAGRNIGHWGGRFIWQLADHESLLVAWKELPEGNPSEVESQLIDGFREVFGARPFANLTK